MQDGKHNRDKKSFFPQPCWQAGRRKTRDDLCAMASKAKDKDKADLDGAFFISAECDTRRPGLLWLLSLATPTNARYPGPHADPMRCTIAWCSHPSHWWPWCCFSLTAILSKALDDFDEDEDVRGEWLL